MKQAAAKTFVLSRLVQGEREAIRERKGVQPIRKASQDENRMWQDKEIFVKGEHLKE